jgi:hypothetical protein
MLLRFMLDKIIERLFLFLMAVFAQALFALVRCHLMSFAFFSAWHDKLNLWIWNYFFFLT